MIKKTGKYILCKILERQVKQLRARHNIRIIAVCGSVGKTSTKLAIAQTLSQRLKVIYQEGNYNDRLTVPLVFFGQTEPGIFAIAGWLKVLRANRKQIKGDYKYKLAVLELGTDAPGQLKAFSYLQPELVVVTAVAVEHMEYFGTLDAVAKEELTPLTYSSKVLLNFDDVPAAYLPTTEFISYGVEQHATYRLEAIQPKGLKGQQLTFNLGFEKVTVETSLIGPSIAKSLLAAAAVAASLEWSGDAISAALKAVKPVSGRMQLLAGQKDSKIIDDTYNASPIATRAALGFLQEIEAPQRIAILGSMNELGDSSASEHAKIGQACDPHFIDYVVTIGRAAAEHLAPAAEQAGCKVISFMDPYEAGAFVRDLLKPGTVVLAKGSQNGVFAEEAVKLLLANPADSEKLVRQSSYWLDIKQQQFPGFH